MKVATATAGLVVVAGAIAGIAVWYWKSPAVPHTTADDADDAEARPTSGSGQSAGVSAAPVPPTPRAPPPLPFATPGPNRPTTRRDEPAPITEAHLMATLRAMGGTAPQRSIDLARDGQRRFPNSADAAERDFVVVQSLVNLKRFHEAQDAARAMVSKYPDNQFALDAQRHLLVYPLDQPSREEMQQQMPRDQ